MCGSQRARLMEELSDAAFTIMDQTDDPLVRAQMQGIGATLLWAMGDSVTEEIGMLLAMVSRE